MFGQLKRRISRTLNRAGEFLTGPNYVKQFKNAILDEEEDKSISILLAMESEPQIEEKIYPSKPFPSKKVQSNETPLHLAAKCAMLKLINILMERGGDPSFCTSKQETALHAVCSRSDKSQIRFAILQLLLSWAVLNEKGEQMEKVSVNKVDFNGNLAIHYAASNGLVNCVEELTHLGSILSLVNKSNLTCCELVDQNNYKDLALMLELALLFQPEDSSWSALEEMLESEFRDQNGRLMLDTVSLDNSHFNQYVEDCIMEVSRRLGWMNSRLYLSRAEALLNHYSWNVAKLLQEYADNPEKVLTSAKMDPTTTIITPSTAHTSQDANHSDLDLIDIKLDNDPTSPIDITDKEKSDNSDADICMICGEEMETEKDLDYFISHPHIKDSVKYALSCLSKHTFCIDCWSAHLNVQIGENGLGCLQCPGFKCGEILDTRWAQYLLKPELIERLHTSRTRHIVDCAGFRYCPVEQCGLIIFSQKDLGLSQPGSPGNDPGLPCTCICANGHAFCMSCSLPAHSPCSCSEFPSWQKLINEEIKSVNANEQASGEEIANALWVAANTKRCPRCGTAIEKDEGCNHMSCRKCHKEFCWICMQDWSLHSENTGGYFQCNRFVDSNDTTTPSSNPNPILDGDEPFLMEERGNAHLEALRLRQKNRIMARFIHHFTRYQAHGESVKMETKMYKETIKRIADGLILCHDDKLIWLQGKAALLPSLTGKSHSEIDLNRPEGGVTPLSPSDPKHALETFQKYKTINYPSLQFLSDGFEELMKCRYLLQWSYAYAFYEFADDPEDPKRRSTRYRLRAQEHRTQFEILQAELETSIETLSDVVARRRLRASQAQIIQTTKTTKIKRVEFESLMISYAVAVKLAASQVNTPNTARSSSSASRSRPTSSRSRNRHIPDDNDLTNLIVRLNLATREIQQSPQGPRPVSGIANEEDEDHEDHHIPTTVPTNSANYSQNTRQVLEALHRRNQERQARLPPSGGSPTRLRRRYRGRNTYENTTASPRRPSPRFGESEDEHEPSSSASHPQESEQDHIDDDDEDELWEEDEIDDNNILRFATDEMNNDLSGLNSLQFSRLAQRAEEEAALNRAILMSLQMRGPSVDEHGSILSPSEDNITSLISMGFTRDQAVQSLRASGNNLELAANELLGIDF